MKFRACLFAIAVLLGPAGSAFGQPDTVHEVAPGVFFHQGDSSRGHCNNGWVMFDDHVFVIDANFPSGAQVIMPKIADSTNRPVRIVFDTHHHSDHAYGNRLWAEQGAVLVAHVGVRTEMSEREPADWNARAASRPDVAATSLKLPSVLFDEHLYFDDGDRRVELHWFGIAHTRGDGFAWLPKQKVLFTGDACVNGAYNFVGNGDIHKWIETLESVKHLGAEIVCPGHGPVGGPEIIADQQQFFIEVVKRAKALRDAGRSAAEAKAAVADIDRELKAIPAITRYVGTTAGDKIEKAWRELGGESFPK